ncbi:universal stress protein [Streptomyces chumphonensis]|uniref:universal stress protein n=1 Tax=Streptomyces chumphonensis TaxID=1214925 RepID=UPI003D755AFE
MTHTVTVGLDGSSESLAATDWAADEAALRGATLRLVQVYEAVPVPYSAVVEADAESRAAHRICAEAAERASRRHPGLPTRTDVRRGRPHQELVEASGETDLLVLGSRGLGRLLGHLVGSVGLRTVPHTACPVVLVRSRRPDDATGERGADDGAPEAADQPREILLGVDVDEPCEELLAFAFEAAARRDAPLRAVHSWRMPLIYGADPYVLPPEVFTDVSDLATERLRAMLRPWEEKYPGVRVTAQVVSGGPADHLVENAGSAALVVVGRRVRHSPLGTHVGPVALAVLHHAHAPVAVVPHR